VTIVTEEIMLEFELAKLLEGTADAAFAVDLQGEIRAWNKSAEKLFGYPASFALGKSCASLLAGRVGTGTAVCSGRCAILECAGAGSDIPNFDMEIRTSSGQRVWVNVSILVASNGRTERRLAIHFMRDIRKRRSSEELTSKVLRMARRIVDSAEEARNLPPVLDLTEQQRKILGLLGAGKSTTEVTRELQISGRTLRNHLHHVNQKLHTRSRLEAVIEALKRGLI
jgi:PAS domain S-box-containing protein